ncbi:hypothetical protein FOA43_000318 [Brettanomyces nanus]|uniref:Metacaspase-1 n=1 Tax=Eeniella nana TaxID=13502 RepID=A0A875S0N6_EENNA|nr:uncharacterized protein FOA43_000318 [Brettanomyces nanus]QPG73014.1 hypothetical protein FOA43_000318 [Brettanomyces nanus]
MQVSPKILEFCSPFTKQQTQEVTVSNDTSSYLAFKVKTTAPKIYCVRPNASTVAPGESVTVHIILQGLAEEPAIGTKCKDKFLFVSVPCDDTVDPKLVSNEWASLQKAVGGSSKGIKMKVSFNYGAAINPIQEEEKEPEDAEISEVPEVPEHAKETTSDAAAADAVASAAAATGATATTSSTVLRHVKGSKGSSDSTETEKTEKKAPSSINSGSHTKVASNVPPAPKRQRRSVLPPPGSEMVEISSAEEKDDTEVSDTESSDDEVVIIGSDGVFTIVMFPGRSSTTYSSQQKKNSSRPQAEYSIQEVSAQSYPPQGYPPQGYPPQGYPPQGYPPQGYPPQGYEPPPAYSDDRPQAGSSAATSNYERPACPTPQNLVPGKLYENQNSRAANTVNGVTYENPDEPPPMPSQSVMSYQINGETVQDFEYSQCNGVRKALLIGINYIGTGNQLRGCINDANNMRRFLLTNGYPSENIVMLTDDQKDFMSIPTRQNIIRAMQWLVKDARPGDSLFFHYSGHGGQEDDLDGDEADGKDDCIYPVDFKQCGSLIDDIMHDIMVRPLPAGCRLTAIFDSCHSGSALDLPFVYRAQNGGLKEYNVWKESGGDAVNILMGYASRNPMEMFSGAKSIYKRFAANTGGNQEAIKQQKMSAADVIMFSGCKDSQTSADAQEMGQFTGALSFAFIQVLSQNPMQSYLTLLQNIRAVLSTKYTQKPQLSSSHQIDPNIRFIM